MRAWEITYDGAEFVSGSKKLLASPFLSRQRKL